MGVMVRPIQAWMSLCEYNALTALYTLGRLLSIDLDICRSVKVLGLIQSTANMQEVASDI